MIPNCNIHAAFFAQDVKAHTPVLKLRKPIFHACSLRILRVKNNVQGDHTLEILQTLFLRALAATSLDVKAAPEIQDSDVRLIDTAMSALADVVYRYESELLAMVSLPNFGTSLCRRSSCYLLTLAMETHCEGLLHVHLSRSV